jgi:hypothetical protein
VGQAIGNSLPLAIGVAISPIPIIAIILMLLSKRAGANSTAFLVGWMVGIVAVLSAVVAVAGTATLETDTGPTATASWIKIGLGVLLLIVGSATGESARRPVRSRPSRSGSPPSRTSIHPRPADWASYCLRSIPRTSYS